MAFFSAFAPFGVASFSADEGQCKAAYDSLQDTLGPAFEGPNSDASTYAIAMALGISQMQLDGASAQADPYQVTALISDLERDYQIIPAYNATLNERQDVLAAAMTLAAGADETNIEAGLTALLGARFVGYRALHNVTEAVVNVGDNRDADWMLPLPEYLTPAELATGTCSACWHQRYSRWVTISSAAVVDNTAYSDDDGLTWTVGDGSLDFIASGWTAVASNGHRAVAVGTDIGAYSDDGVTWHAMSSSLFGFEMEHVAAGSHVTGDSLSISGQLFVACGLNTITYSLDGGDTWDSGTSPSAQLVGLANGNGVWIFVSDTGTVYVEADPVAITLATTSSVGGTCTGAAFGNGVFVVARSSGVPRWSADGITWVDCTGVLASVYPKTITFCDGLFVGINNSSPSTGIIYTSTDGKAWTSTTQTDSDFVALAGRPNMFIAASAGKAFRQHTLPRPAISPPDAQIRLGTLDGPLSTGLQYIDYTMLLSPAEGFQFGEFITIEPGRLGIEERCEILSSSSVTVGGVTTGTISVVLKRPHPDGVHATTAPWPFWRSTRCHAIILVTADVLTDRLALARTNLFLRKILPAAYTWSIVEGNGGYTTPFAVGSAVGQAMIGGILEAD